MGILKNKVYLIGVTNVMNKKYITPLTVGICAGLLVSIAYYTSNLAHQKPGWRNTVMDEARGGRYYTIADEKGRTILHTGLKVYAGDEYIDSDNIRYRITRVNGYNAWARSLGKAKTVSAALPQESPRLAMAQNIPRVGIYHTHTDESFIPTQKTSSQPGHGAIIQVGNALANTLSQNGITVIHDATIHDPHDMHAYYRSRRTVFKLLRQNLDYIFDVHRDSAPAEAYFTYITGVESGRVMIVVGRQNPHMGTNLEFAWRVKQEADKIYPDLIRGIFIGHGNYNQDLHPRALLFEISTDTQPQSLAEDAAHCLGDVLATIIKK